MKRIQIIIPVLLGAFCTGCDLDIEPQDRYDQQTFWYSAKAAEGGLTGCYNALLENGIYGRAAVYWEDDATPNGYNFSNDDSWTTIANGAQTATSGGIIANRWSHAYKGIGRCNTLLDNIDLNRELDKSVIEEYKNQARFLRVLFYYMLTTYYGDCPLITTTPAMEHKSLPRTPRTEVVSFMLGELEQLSKVLPPKAEPGRPTSGAALALKARILLFEASPLLNPGHDDQKWRDAADAARAVMDCDSDYELFTAPGQIGSAYRNLFLESGENSSECIFSVQCMNQNKLGLSFEREPQLVLVHALYAENTFGTVLSAFEEEIAVGRTDLARGGEEFVIRIAVHHGAGRVGGVTPLLVVVAGVEQRAGLEEQDAGFEGQCRA